VQEALDIVTGEGGDREATQAQRLDVTFDPAPVHSQRADFLRDLAARQQTADLDVGEIGITKFGDRGRLARGALLSRGIGPRDDFAEDASSFGASAVRCPRGAMTPNRMPTVAPASRAVLKRGRSPHRSFAAARQSPSPRYPRPVRPVQAPAPRAPRSASARSPRTLRFGCLQAPSNQQATTNTQILANEDRGLQCKS
jgi:hypothetical protein